MDSFFLEDDPDAKLSQRQRKRIRNAQLAYKSKRDAKSENSDSAEDEHDNDDFDLTRHSEEESEESDHETAEQKRLRLAKSYLEKVKEDVYDINEGEIDAKEIDKQLISERVRGDVLESQGKLFRVIADEFASLHFSEFDVKVFKCGKAGPQLSLTCATFVSSGCNADGSSPKAFVYAGSKDATVIKWDFVTGKTINIIKGGLKPTKKLLKSIGSRAIECIGHNDHILTMDASFDGKFIATGGRDKVIYIWSTADESLIGKLQQHRDAVSSLKFRNGSNQLYSASFDRSIKVWNAEELSYVETLYPTC